MAKTEIPAIELMDCEKVLLNEIAIPKMKRLDIALTYRLALMSSESKSIDWVKVNMAIIERWSMAGLKWIKNRAWGYGRRKRNQND